MRNFVCSDWPSSFFFSHSGQLPVSPPEPPQAHLRCKRLRAIGNNGALELLLACASLCLITCAPDPQPRWIPAKRAALALFAEAPAQFAIGLAALELRALPDHSLSIPLGFLPPMRSVRPALHRYAFPCRNRLELFSW